MHSFTRDTRECRALAGCTTQRFDFCNTTKTHEHGACRTLEPHPRRRLSPTPRCRHQLALSARSELRDVIPMLRIASKQPRRRTRTPRRFRREQESRTRSDSELQARRREAPRFPRPARANLVPSPLFGPTPRFIAPSSAAGWNPQSLLRDDQAAVPSCSREGARHPGDRGACHRVEQEGCWGLLQRPSCRAWAHAGLEEVVASHQVRAFFAFLATPRSDGLSAGERLGRATGRVFPESADDRSAQHGFCDRTFTGLTCRELREAICLQPSIRSTKMSPLKHYFFSTMSLTRMATIYPQVIQMAGSSPICARGLATPQLTSPIQKRACE